MAKNKQQQTTGLPNFYKELGTTPLNDMSPDDERAFDAFVSSKFTDSISMRAVEVPSGTSLNLIPELADIRPIDIQYTLQTEESYMKRRGWSVSDAIETFRTAYATAIDGFAESMRFRMDRAAYEHYLSENKRRLSAIGIPMDLQIKPASESLSVTPFMLPKNREQGRLLTPTIPYILEALGFTPIGVDTTTYENKTYKLTRKSLLDVALGKGEEASFFGAPLGKQAGAPFISMSGIEDKTTSIAGHLALAQTIIGRGDTTLAIPALRDYLVCLMGRRDQVSSGKRAPMCDYLPTYVPETSRGIITSNGLKARTIYMVPKLFKLLLWQSIELIAQQFKMSPFNGYGLSLPLKWASEAPFGNKGYVLNSDFSAFDKTQHPTNVVAILEYFMKKNFSTELEWARHELELNTAYKVGRELRMSKNMSLPSGVTCTSIGNSLLNIIHCVWGQVLLDGIDIYNIANDIRAGGANAHTAIRVLKDAAVFFKTHSRVVAQGDDRYRVVDTRYIDPEAIEKTEDQLPFVVKYEREAEATYLKNTIAKVDGEATAVPQLYSTVVQRFYGERTTANDVEDVLSAMAFEQAWRPFCQPAAILKVNNLASLYRHSGSSNKLTTKYRCELHQVPNNADFWTDEFPRYVDTAEGNGAISAIVQNMYYKPETQEWALRTSEKIDGVLAETMKERVNKIQRIVSESLTGSQTSSYEQIVENIKQLIHQYRT